MKAQTQKVLEETVTTVKTQLTEVERVWTESIEQLNTRIQTAEKDARDFARRIEVDSRDKLNQLKEQVQIDQVKTRLDNANLIKRGVRLGSETAEKLGLAQIADVDKLTKKLDGLGKKVETVRRRSTQITELKKSLKEAGRAQTKLEKRVVTLEKGLKGLTKKLERATQSATTKAATKKTAAKKSASTSRTAKK